jgi:phospholipid transport system substrate-binding protein
VPLAFLLALLTLASPVSAAAPELDPASTIREAERLVRSALMSKAVRPEFARIGAVHADYEELARRSLGKHWAAQNQADRSALVRSLRALLEETYLPRLAGADPLYAFAVEKASRSGDEAEVRVRTQSREQQAVTIFRLKQGKDGRWRIFDVTIGGLAILEGYQEQFPQLLEMGGMPKLLKTLEAERRALQQKPAKQPPAAAASPGG